MCDGTNNNRKMWKELGINGVLGSVIKYFTHPDYENREVCFFRHATYF